MTTLIKLGGSLITNKNIQQSFRKKEVQRIVLEVKEALEKSPQSLIIGHGSGSFGHFEAHKYNTIHGVTHPTDWLGFTKVAFAASQLSQLVWDEFSNQDLPVIRFQPSASIDASDNRITNMNTSILVKALNHGLIPIVHGDVAFDSERGGTIISTETIFSHIIKFIDVKRIILLGEVDGVQRTDKTIIPIITPSNLKEIESFLGKSGGVDVTGGMYQKVLEMITLIEEHHNLEVFIANGKTTNLLKDLLMGKNVISTKIMY